MPERGGRRGLTEFPGCGFLLGMPLVFAGTAAVLGAPGWLLVTLFFTPLGLGLVVLFVYATRAWRQHWLSSPSPESTAATPAVPPSRLLPRTPCS